MSFSSLGPSGTLARAVEAAGYSQPIPVQQRAIPAVLQGRDLMVAAQTGTGKTGGLALPVLERLFPVGHPDREHRHGSRQARVLALTPTRELVIQVHDSFKVYAHDPPLSSTCISDGVGTNLQIQALAKGADVLVACPGHPFNLAGQNEVDLSYVEILVLDEAGRMFDMGSIHDAKKVLTKPPPKRQSLLFSTTFLKDIADLANKLLYNPERIEVTPSNTTVGCIEQHVLCLPAPQKRVLSAHLVTVGAWEQVLVFTRTKHGANRLVEYLIKHDLSATAIHGNKSQNVRTKALADFKVNDVRILMATDIAAHGLDIDQLSHMVDYELSNVEEGYAHCAGRTGRAGRSGEAISLVTPDEEKLLKVIEKMTRQCTPDGDAQGSDPEAVPPGVAQPKPCEAPQKQLRRDKEWRSSREHKPKDAQASNSDNNVAAAQDGTEKLAGKCRRRGGKNKENREAGQTQQPQQGRETRLTEPNQPPKVDGSRDPEEFLDDDFGNFGNRADYVSPYRGQENKGRGRRGGQQKPQGGTSQQGYGQDQGRTRGKSQGAVQGGTRGQGADQGKVKKLRASKPCGQGRENASRMSDVPLCEPPEYGTGKQPSCQSVVINKRDLARMDRFPTAEQLDELKPRRKGERPALLTRNR